MTHQVEYEGTKATFREPMGREAVAFIRDVRKLPPTGLTPAQEKKLAANPNAKIKLTAAQEKKQEEFVLSMTELIHDWMPKLVVTPKAATGNAKACWKLYKALGRSVGPLIGLFTEFIGESGVIPDDKLDALPFRDREGTASPGGEADAD